VPASNHVLERIPKGARYTVSEDKLVLRLREEELVEVLTALDMETVRSARIERPTPEDAYLELVSKG